MENGKPKFYIDLPNPYDTEGPWNTVDQFDTKEEAINYAKKYFGADDNGNINIISTVME